MTDEYDHTVFGNAPVSPDEVDVAQQEKLSEEEEHPKPRGGMFAENQFLRGKLTERERRGEALMRAVQLYSRKEEIPWNTTRNVVEAAEAFDKFLKGE